MSAELAQATMSRSPPPHAAPLVEAPLPAVVMLGTLLAMLRRRKQPFLLAAILVPLLALVAITQTKPRYTAMGTVLYDPSAYAARELESILRADTSSESMLASQIEILHGLSLAQRLGERFYLDASPEFNPALRAPSIVKRVTAALLAFLTPGPAALQPTADIVARLVQKAIDAKAVKASRVLEVSFTANDPVLARDAANALIALYIDDQRTVKTEAVRRANEWLDRRVAELRTDVEQAEARIATYRSGAGLVEGVQAGLDTERISRLSADLLQARNDLADALARLEAAAGKANQGGLQGGPRRGPRPPSRRAWSRCGHSRTSFRASSSRC